MKITKNKNSGKKAEKIALEQTFNQQNQIVLDYTQSKLDNYSTFSNRNDNKLQNLKLQQLSHNKTKQLYSPKLNLLPSDSLKQSNGNLNTEPSSIYSFNTINTSNINSYTKTNTISSTDYNTSLNLKNKNASNISMIKKANINSSISNTKDPSKLSKSNNKLKEKSLNNTINPNISYSKSKEKTLSKSQIKKNILSQIDYKFKPNIFGSQESLVASNINNSSMINNKNEDRIKSSLSRNKQLDTSINNSINESHNYSMYSNRSSVNGMPDNYNKRRGYKVPFDNKSTSKSRIEEKMESKIEKLKTKHNDCKMDKIKQDDNMIEINAYTNNLNSKEQVNKIRNNTKKPDTTGNTDDTTKSQFILTNTESRIKKENTNDTHTNTIIESSFSQPVIYIKKRTNQFAFNNKNQDNKSKINTHYNSNCSLPNNLCSINKMLQSRKNHIGVNNGMSHSIDYNSNSNKSDLPPILERERSNSLLSQRKKKEKFRSSYYYSSNSKPSTPSFEKEHSRLSESSINNNINNDKNNNYHTHFKYNLKENLSKINNDTSIPNKIKYKHRNREEIFSFGDCL